MAVKDSQSIRYYHGDHLGSTKAVTDGAGNKLEAIDYYPFGESRADTGSVNVNHKYTSQELDYEVGLYNYNARLYDPEMGRFISADSIVPDPANPQSLNRYSYVLNNPMIFTDPTGHMNFFQRCWEDITGKTDREAEKNNFIPASGYSGGSSFGPSGGDGSMSFSIYASNDGGGTMSRQREFDDAFARLNNQPGLGGPPSQVFVSTGGTSSGASSGGGANDGRGASGSTNGNFLGTGIGESSAQWYANKYNETGSLSYAAGGLLASLWTPETYGYTATVLLTGVSYGLGSELTVGKNFRFAPLGNRTGNKFGELPHYHRRGVPGLDGKTPSGQGIGRHRPWETKSPDTSFWDRF